jgi:uncharacterized surface protein with fasciclin (FAS1) repeats
MGNRRKNFLLISVILAVALFGCRPDEEYFAKPETLSGPIYQQLESMGNFTHYLQCLDRTPYGDILSKSGSWTVFAPNDDGFAQYLSENGYTSVASMPYDKVSAIVKYSIISGAYSTTSLTYWQGQWYEGNAFRKRTQFKDTITVMDANDYPEYLNWKNRTYKVDPSLNRYKTTIFWLPSYVTGLGGGTGFFGGNYTDLSTIFGTQMSEDYMWVKDSKVLKEDVAAENGLIFEIEKVIEPIPNLYQNLTSEEYNGKYTLFKKIIDRFGEFRYNRMVKNPVTGEMDSIFHQVYLTGSSSNYPAYALNDENMPYLLSVQDHTENASPGLTVPTNDALTSYLSSSLLGTYYSSYEEMPLDVLGMFININFYVQNKDMLPSKVGNIFNSSLEKVDLQMSDVINMKQTSNGLFYGINKVFTTNSFSTVIAPILLDTTYSIMYKYIKALTIESALKGGGIDFSVIGVRNTQFINTLDPNSDLRKVTVVGRNKDLSVIYLAVTGDPTAANNRTYPIPGTVPTAADLEYVTTTMKSIILNQIIDAPINLAVNNYYQTRSGDFVYVSNGTRIQGGGNVYDNTYPNIVSSLNQSNGVVYQMDRIINPPIRYTYGTLSDMGANFSRFQQVITGAQQRVAITGNTTDYLIGLLDLRKSYTLFAPNNTAVNEAVTNGVIPNPDPVYLNTLTPVQLATARIKLENFAKKHFILRAVPTDGKTTGVFQSLYVKAVVDLIPEYQEYSIVNDHILSSLTLKDPDSGTTLVTTGPLVNKLSRKVVVHEIGTYLR